MNIFRQFQIKREIDKQTEIVQLSFERLETYYKKHFSMCYVPEYISLVIDFLRKQTGNNSIEFSMTIRFALEGYDATNGIRKSMLSRDDWLKIEPLRKYYRHKIMYDKGALEEFKKMNEEFVEDFNKLMELFHEASINTLNSQWETMGNKHNRIIEELNEHPKYENKE